MLSAARRQKSRRTAAISYLESINWAALGAVGLTISFLCLLAMWAVCMLRLPRARRRGLLAAFLLTLGLAAVLFGGAWLLDRLGLAWRVRPKETLCILLWAAGLALSLFTVRCFYRLLHDLRPKLAGWAAVAGLFCMATAMLLSTLCGGLWAMSTTVDEEIYPNYAEIFPDGQASHHYAYYGPLFRSRNPIHS